MSEKKETDVFYITHSGELLFWLIILLGIVILTFFGHIFHSEKGSTYNIFMPDVDGLIVGSPVRTMGIEIGHVTKIKPVKDDVYVKFIITDQSVDLPQGTVATVEFTGLAGSKSLELYLPDHDTYIDPSVPLLEVSSPKRLHDAAGLLREMFKHVGNIIWRSSKFGHDLSEIDFPVKKGGFDKAEDFLKYADEVIDVQQRRVDDLGRRINEIRKEK